MRFRFRAFLFLIALFITPSPVIITGQSLDGNNLNRVIQTLTSASISFERRSLLSGYGGFGSSILVRFSSHSNPLADKNQLSATEGHLSGGAFVLAVPLYADFAVDAALALTRQLSALQRDSACNIIVAFLGDELMALPYDVGGIMHKGLRDLVSLNSMPEDWLICYLDVSAPPEELVVNHGTRGYVAPLDVIKPLPSLLRARAIPFSFLIRYNAIYKLGLAEGPDPINTAWEKEINSFVFSGKPASVNSEKETISPDDVALFLTDYAQTISFPILEADRHYSIIVLPGGNIRFLNEELTVALLVIMFALFLIIVLVLSVSNYIGMIFHLKLFFKYIWIFLILLPLLVVSIKAAGFLYSMVLSYHNVPSELVTYAGAGLTLLLSVLLFAMPSPLLSLVKFPGRANFYSFSSVLFILLCLLFAVSLDFSYVPIFLWAFLLISLGASLSNPLLIFACVILAPILAFGASVNIIKNGSGRIIALLLSPGIGTLVNWLSAIMAALFILPIFLLSKYGAIVIQKTTHNGLEPRPNRKNRLIIIPAAVITVLLIMFMQVLLISRGIKKPERRQITEYGTGNTLNISINNRNFQDSQILTLEISAEGNPVRFDVSLESSTGRNLLPIYSSMVPFDRDETGQKIIFYPGEFPPNPLRMEIVVPQNFDGSFNVTALYNSWDPSLDPGDEPSSSDYLLEVWKSLEINNLSSRN